MKRSGKEKRGHGAGAFIALMLLLVILAPSPGDIDTVSDMIAKPTEKTDLAIENTASQTQTPIPTPKAMATLSPTVPPVATPVPTPQPQASASVPVLPLETARPAKTLRAAGEPFNKRGDGSVKTALPMDDFSPGAALSEDGYDPSRKTYADETISVTVYQEKYDYTIYTVADVKITDASQLRTALAGTKSSPARAKMTKLAQRANAVAAIDGDYYADRKGAYAVRQGTLLSDSFASDLDLLAIDHAGDFHCLTASEKREGIASLEGDIYQCFSFGPVLVKNGERLEIPEKYQFGATYLNPRAGVGQLGELHYLMVVASGRIDESMSITVETLRDFMYAKGCVQAYNLDGGASAELYFDGESASPLTDSGERGLYDILYFASAAVEKEAGE